MDGDDNNDLVDNSSSDDEEEFTQISAVATAAIGLYYDLYIHKNPCMVSYHTGLKWLRELMEGHETRCLNMFRMKKDALLLLCTTLEVNHGLKSSKNMSILEKLCICLYILAQGASNRNTQERFQHSGETVSRIFREVLHALCSLAKDLIKPVDPEFSNIPREILHDQRYMPYFKNCIGAIDGTHVHAHVSLAEQVPFIGRKGIPTQNIMAACSFDMQFTFVLAGWEGTAHDTRIFYRAINDPNLNFSKPPPGKYYLVDAGYPQINGFLKPYKGVRYHLPDFRRGQPPRGYQETFNKAHSSLRCCIERTFGVWKQRWKILRDMPTYPFVIQRDIVVASMALHNFIRRYSLNDPVFTRFDESPDFVPQDIFEDVSSDVLFEENPSNSRTIEMDSIRDEIAFSLMAQTN